MKILGIAGNSSAGKDTIAAILRDQHGWQVVAFADALKRLVGKIFDYDVDVLFGEPAKRNAIDVRVGSDWYWNNVRRRAVVAYPEMDMLFEGRVSREQIVLSFEAFLSGCRSRGTNLTPRYVLQQVGTEFGRGLWDKVWVNSVKQTIEDIGRGCQYSRMEGLGNHFMAVTPPLGIVVVDTRFPNEVEDVHGMDGKVLWVDASKRVPRDPKLAHASEPRREDFADTIDFDLDNNGHLSELPGKIKKALSELWP